jgi:nitroimidazol reductase NimA-like FMN-containing flavoprotein (pyridoxamine 5'-phosphate oxidase superfamily)
MPDSFWRRTHPNIAPFLYIFDGKFIYILLTKYGRKIEQFRRNPLVTVEVEKYPSDLSNFSFVTIPGRLTELRTKRSTECQRDVR